MKYFISFIALCLVSFQGLAQCAMCTKTAAGLDDGSAEGLNTGIIFLAFTPLTIIMILGFLWYRKNKHEFV